jgi:hypothetical protein
MYAGQQMENEGNFKFVDMIDIGTRRSQAATCHGAVYVPCAPGEPELASAVLKPTAIQTSTCDPGYNFRLLLFLARASQQTGNLRSQLKVNERSFGCGAMSNDLYIYSR